MQNTPAPRTQFLRKITIAGVAALALAAAGTYSYLHWPTRVVARVGEARITRHDLNLRFALLRVLAGDPAANHLPGRTDRESLAIAQAQLAQAERFAEVLSRRGRPITEQDLAAEAKRIDAETRMPERLREVQALFGEDRAAYLKIYVRPILAERRLYAEVFLRDPQAQAVALAEARAFLAKLRAQPVAALRDASFDQLRSVFAGTRFEALGVSAELGLRIARPPAIHAAPPATGPAPVQQALDAAASAVGGDWLREVVPAASKPGEIYPRVIEEPTQYRVVWRLADEATRPKEPRFGSAVFTKNLDFAAFVNSFGITESN